MHDPLQATQEIREQLASEKRRLAFFFGAGTSMAVGIPGISELTDKVSDRLESKMKTKFENIKSEFEEDANVENVLDRIRIYRELIGSSEEKEFGGLKGAAQARQLDVAICQAIRDVVSITPPKGVYPYLIFAQWIRALHCSRNCPVEIFTTNYDLLLEKSMENLGVPFFDGFVGSVAPFFIPESVEAQERKDDESAYPPRIWTRLWKLHGSINWHLQKHTEDGRERITRLSGEDSKSETELMIFPSREKYAQSRKLPFITFQDRFRKFVSYGESLIVIVGYSFSDEHLNDIIIQGLRSNPRLSISAFFYSNLPDSIITYGQEYRNLSLYGPFKACIGGQLAQWIKPSQKSTENDSWPFWDVEKNIFTLGDFNKFTDFLGGFSGFQSVF